MLDERDRLLEELPQYVQVNGTEKERFLITVPLGKLLLVDEKPRLRSKLKTESYISWFFPTNRTVIRRDLAFARTKVPGIKGS